LAWRRALQNCGALPTYPKPELAEVKQLSGEVLGLLAEARVWVDDELAPDLESQWPEVAKFRLNGADGVVAAYERDQRRGFRFVRIADGRRRAVFAVVIGQSTFQGIGTISNWFAFDDQRVFGLDPREAYTYVPAPREHGIPHLLSASADVLVSVPMKDGEKLMIDLGLPSSAAGYDFFRRFSSAEKGIVVAGKMMELTGGATFRQGVESCGSVTRKCIFAHPAWRLRKGLEQAAGHEQVPTVGRFKAKLPAEKKPVLDFKIGLRDGAEGKSGGVQFRVEINGEPVFDQVWAKCEWKDVRVPLERWAGKQISVAFVTTPGPNGNTSHDWACWGEPRISYEISSQPVGVVFASPRPVRHAVSSDPHVTSIAAGVKDGLHLRKARLAVPGRIAFLWAEPRPVELPLDLANARFDLSASIQGSPVALPMPHVWARPGGGSSKGVHRSGLNAHPPNFGRASIDHFLKLPEEQQITLELAVGLRDRSQSNGLIFIVEANTEEVFRRHVARPDGWHAAKIDLSRFAGRALLLGLIVDSNGPHFYDWATWAELVLK